MPTTVVRTNVGTTAGTTTTMTTAHVEWSGSFLITMAISGTFVGLVLVAIGCGCCLRCGRTRLDSIHSSFVQDRIPQGSRNWEGWPPNNFHDTDCIFPFGLPWFANLVHQY